MTREEASAGESVGPTPGGSYFLVVLGGGPAAVAAARAAAQRGLHTALILPPDKPIPPTQPTPFGEAIRAVQIRTGLIPPAPLPELPGVDVFTGRAVFHRSRAIALDDRELSFRRAIIASGLKPASSALDVAEESGWLRPETLARLTEVPRRLAVIGLGAEGCAWATAFSRLGSQVHLVGHDAKLLSAEDPEAAAAVRTRLDRDGIRLYPDCGELAIEATGNLRSVTLHHHGRREKLLVEEVLFCAPRRPATGEWNLEAAGVACDAEGILVDEKLRTSNRWVYAAGAVCGPAFASPQAAQVTAEIAVHNAASWLPRSVRRQVVSRTLPTEPAVAQAAMGCGRLPGKTADGESDEIDTLRVDLAEGDAVLPEGLREGFVKVRVQRRSGRLVGALVVARQADELLAPLALLMSRRLPLWSLAKPVVPAPSRLDLLCRLARQVKKPAQSLSRVLYLNCCGVPPKRPEKSSRE